MFCPKKRGSPIFSNALFPLQNFELIKLKLLKKIYIVKNYIKLKIILNKATFKVLILITVLSAYYILPTWAQSQGTDKSIPTIPQSIYPQSTLIQQTGNTYSLTNNTNVTFTVTISNIVFEGNGHSVKGIYFVVLLT